MRRFLPLLLVAFSAAAQEKLVESIEVHVVNVDVVVTDRAGNPVTGLKRDDFEIYENGKPQAITNFYEVRPDDVAAPRTKVAGETTVTTEPTAAPPPEARARHIVVFIDDYSVEPHTRLQLLASLAKFVEKEMRDGDEGTVISWSHSTRVLVPFTTNKSALLAAIQKIEPRSSIQARSEDAHVREICMDATKARKPSERAQLMNDCSMLISTRADEIWALERDLLEAMRLTMAALGGIEGKKAMIVAGAHLPEKPGLQLFQFFNDLFHGGRGMSPYLSASHRSQTLPIIDVAREANANGVTLYTIDTNDTRNGASAENREPVSPEDSFMEFTDTKAAYDNLAKITGGISIANTTNLDLAFDTVARDLTSWYSLGYRPSDETSTGDRKLKVKAKNPAYRVRTRETYAFKSHDEQISDRVLANIAHDNIKSQWEIGLRTGSPSKDGRNYLVPIEVTVPPTVTLLPATENKLAGGFDVYIVVGNDDGKTSNITKRLQPITIPAAVEKAVRAQPLMFNATLMMRPGKNTISIAVVDEISNTTGFARATVVAR